MEIFLCILLGLLFITLFAGVMWIMIVAGYESSDKKQSFEEYLKQVMHSMNNHMNHFGF